MSITWENICEELFYFCTEAVSANLWALVGMKSFESEMFGYEHANFLRLFKTKDINHIILLTRILFIR